MEKGTRGNIGTRPGGSSQHQMLHGECKWWIWCLSKHWIRIWIPAYLGMYQAQAQDHDQGQEQVS